MFPLPGHVPLLFLLLLLYLIRLILFLNLLHFFITFYRSLLLITCTFLPASPFYYPFPPLLISTNFLLLSLFLLHFVLPRVFLSLPTDLLRLILYKNSLRNWMASNSKLSSISGILDAKQIFLSIIWRWLSQIKFYIRDFHCSLSINSNSG
jgi:hypothetical protein